MNRLRRFGPAVHSGLWHVHTDRTDGANSVAELVAFAAEREFPLLGVVEHVRRDLTYDFDALVRDVRRHASANDIEHAVGCEAKVLDVDGTLDVDEATRDSADVVYAAYHGTPFSRDEYVESVRAMLANPDVDVWAHPFAYAQREGFDLGPDERAAVLDAVRTNDVFFELNLRRPTTAVSLRDELADVPTVVGHDLHDVERWTVGE